MSEHLSNENDARWFNDEVQSHESVLRGFLNKRLQSSADVDDVVQHTYARLVVEKRKGAIRQVKPLLFAIARNAMYDLFRSRRRVPISSASGEELAIAIDDRPTVADQICHQTRMDLLQRSVEALPPRCRQIIELRKFEGLTVPQIADRLGISENTVKTLVAKGVRSIADYVQKHSDKA